MGSRAYIDAIRELRKAGKSDAEIATELSITIYAVECLSRSIIDQERAKKSRHPIPAERTITFKHSVFAAAAPHARRRNMTVQDLIAKIVTTTISDDMIDAVLDDAEAA